MGKQKHWKEAAPLFEIALLLYALLRTLCTWSGTRAIEQAAAFSEISGPGL
jgi:hypothetical protein